MNIQAIETLYKGFRFRSRLEARWAIFLDKCDMSWTYENEGYQLPSGWYLPDFELFDLPIDGKPSAFLEIKPKHLCPTWSPGDENPNIMQKPIELGKHIKTTIIVFGDPYDFKFFWAGGGQMEIDIIAKYWWACKHWAEFARSARFDRESSLPA